MNAQPETASRGLASYGKPLKIILLANMAILFSVFFIVSGVHYLDYDELARTGVRTQGEVLELNCSQHSTFTYQFQVESRNVIGLGNGGNGNPDCTRLKKGDQLEVYYLSNDIAIHTDGDPTQRRDNEKSSMVVAGIMVPLFLLIAYRFIRF